MCYSCSIGAAKSSFELLYESAIVHEIDESPTIKRDFGSNPSQSERATPINNSNFLHDYSKNPPAVPPHAIQIKADATYSPLMRSIQKAPPPPENVFNTHKTIDTLRRQQRQQQRRERKKELKQQHKQNRQNHGDVNPDLVNQNNLQYVPPSIHPLMGNGETQSHSIKVINQNNDQQCSSYVPYNVITTVPMQQQTSCPQCPPQYVVRTTANQYYETQNKFIDQSKYEVKKHCQPNQDNNSMISNNQSQKSLQEEEQAPRIRIRSKSIHCHEYISPLFHEEIVTVVDDCHANLINKQDQRPKPNMIQRRSRSSSGVNNVVLKNWPDHRQNSYETVIAALDEENLIINNVDYFPHDERYPTASMPLHSRLSTSNEALTRPNSRPDGYDAIKNCNECTDQYYLTRSLHRRHVSGRGSKKRGKGGSSSYKVNES